MGLVHQELKSNKDNLEPHHSMTFSNPHILSKSSDPLLHYPHFLTYLLWLNLMNLALQVCFVFSKNLLRFISKDTIGLWESYYSYEATFGYYFMFNL